MPAFREEEHDPGDPPAGVTEHRREPGVDARARGLVHRSTFSKGDLALELRNRDEVRGRGHDLRRHVAGLGRLLAPFHDQRLAGRLRAAHFHRITRRWPRAEKHGDHGSLARSRPSAPAGRRRAGATTPPIPPASSPPPASAPRRCSWLSRTIVSMRARPLQCGHISTIAGSERVHCCAAGAGETRNTVSRDTVGRSPTRAVASTRST